MGRKVASSPCVLSQHDQENLIEKLGIITLQGRDKHGNAVLRITGKFFPARLVGVQAMKTYLEEKIVPKLSKQPFSVVYFHSRVERRENLPGISFLRSIFDALPSNVLANLQALYFVHPGVQSRLFLAIFGRLLFTAGLYGKVNYVSRLCFLWDNVKRETMEVPEYIYEYDERLEWSTPPADYYALETDHPRVYCEPYANSPISCYSMRGIA